MDITTTSKRDPRLEIICNIKRSAIRWRREYPGGGMVRFVRSTACIHGYRTGILVIDHNDLVYEGDNAAEAVSAAEARLNLK